MRPTVSGWQADATRRDTGHRRRAIATVVVSRTDAPSRISGQIIRKPSSPSATRP